MRMDLMKIMGAMLIAGVAITGTGIWLLFTPLANEGGMQGIFIIVSLLTSGLLFLIPAKIYIIIRLMQKKPRAGSNKQR